MILPDVNVLVLAHRADQNEHEPLREWLEAEVNSDRPFFLADIAAAGFLRIVTNPLHLPSSDIAGDGVAFVDGLVAQPTCVPVAAGARHWPILRGLLQSCRRARQSRARRAPRSDRCRARRNGRDSRSRLRAVRGSSLAGSADRSAAPLTTVGTCG